MRSVGISKARTHWFKLLDAVEQGETIVITRRGKEIARLVPQPATASKDSLAAVEKWRETRKGITLGGLRIRDLIEEGRR